MSSEILQTIDTGAILGEGAAWNAQTQTVWWTDIQSRRLFVLSWPEMQLAIYQTPERLCSFGFIEGEDDRIIAAFERGFALFTPHTGDVNWLDKPAALGKGRRLNDGRVGPDGRFWSGSMIEAANKGHTVEDTGFYALNSDRTATFKIGGLQISNGLCWSPDAKTVYFADSPAGKIFAAPFDNASSMVGERRVLAEIDSGGPDGATTDSAGNIWSAIWGASKLVCLSPGGETLHEINVPVPQPTCPVFGGPDLDLIFLTSASEDLDDDQLDAAPLSGDVFVIEAPEGITGLSAPRFRLD